MMRSILVLVIILVPMLILGQNFSIAVVDQNDPTCTAADDGNVLIEAMGGVEPITYVLNGMNGQDSGEFENLSGGDYNVVASDANGLVSELIFSLIDPQPIVLQIDGIDPTCQDALDGMLIISDLNNVNGVSFEISGPSSQDNATGIFNDLGIGTYIISASTSPDCRVVISTELNSDIDCEDEEEEEEGLCTLTFSRVGMQINKVNDDLFNLTIRYSNQSDEIYNITYTQLYDIVEFHIVNRKVMLTQANSFKFENYCATVEKYRSNGFIDESVNNQENADYIDTIEIIRLQEMLAQIKVSECIKI